MGIYICSFNLIGRMMITIINNKNSIIMNNHNNTSNHNNDYLNTDGSRSSCNRINRNTSYVQNAMLICSLLLISDLRFPLSTVLNPLSLLSIITDNDDNGFINNIIPSSYSSSGSSSSIFVSANNIPSLKSLDYRYFVAGGTCAAISHGITTPIDVIKTKIQSNPTKYKNKNMITCAVEICKEDGIGALTTGLGPTIAGYGIEGALKFGVYEIMKTVLVGTIVFGIPLNKGYAYLLSSIIAGAVASVVLCPMESTRIKMVTDPAYHSLSFIPSIAKMLKDDGMFTSFSIGILAMLCKQVPYTFGKQVSFDVFATSLYQYVTENKWAVSVFAAFGASLIACIFSQPGDMILTETFHSSSPTVTTTLDKKHINILKNINNKVKQLQNKPSSAVTTIDNQQQQHTFVHVIQSIYQSGGLAAFFTGTGARIVHVGLIITSQLVIYDIVKQLLGLPATGSH